MGKLSLRAKQLMHNNSSKETMKDLTSRGLRSKIRDAMANSKALNLKVTGHF